jgi:hypothetical protein
MGGEGAGGGYNGRERGRRHATEYINTLLRPRVGIFIFVGGGEEYIYPAELQH